MQSLLTIMTMVVALQLIHLINALFHDKNVEVYLLFKKINKDYYTRAVRVSHWQVVVHFKDTNQYKCYELQTDNGDKGGRITYQISDFNFDGDIYYYYIGQYDASEADLERICEEISINDAIYELGFKDCQTWARLLIGSLSFHVPGIGTWLFRHLPFYGIFSQWPGSSAPARLIDLLAALPPILKQKLSPVKHCLGYKKLNSQVEQSDSKTLQDRDL